MTEPTETADDTATTPIETPEAPDTGQIPDAVEIYVCPECGSWYGSSNAPDLTAVPNIRTSMRNTAREDPSNWGKVAGYRVECQVCKAQGKTVVRLHLSYVRLDKVESVMATEVETMYEEEERRAGTRLQRPT